MSNRKQGIVRALVWLHSRTKGKRSCEHWSILVYRYESCCNKWVKHARRDATDPRAWFPEKRSTGFALRYLHLFVPELLLCHSQPIYSIPIIQHRVSVPSVAR